MWEFQQGIAYTLTLVNGVSLDGFTYLGSERALDGMQEYEDGSVKNFTNVLLFRKGDRLIRVWADGIVTATQGMYPNEY